MQHVAPPTLQPEALETTGAAQPEEAAAVTLPPQNPRWQRFRTHWRFSQYRRLVAVVYLVNVWLLINGIRQGWWATDGIALGTLGNLVVANISLAILIRQQYVINLLFKVATSAPTSWPLSIRWLLGKVYHFGGIHMGGAIAGTVWFAIYLGSLSYHLFSGLGGVSLGLILPNYLLLALLVGMVVMALPSYRHKFHNNFEMMHRFGGWTSLVLFWWQTVAFANLQRGELGLGTALLGSFGFWSLVLVTVSIILPWLRLKKVPVDITRPSNHVILAKFNYGVTPFAGSSTALSRDPLREWHSFANVPSPHEPGFRLTISRAGDWTGDLIDDMPSHVWVKGIPTAGVGNVDKLFKRVVWIATGSGIGPCLPHLLSQETPARLVWSTRNARKTYGDDLVEEILDVQPDALIWNTDDKGRPDLVQLAYEAVVDFDAEAVIVISNQKLTRQVVYGMESRGIPAYGAIWDS